MSTIHGKLVQTKSGLWIREGTSDRYVEGTLREYDQLEVFDEVVLDLGGHIGAFTRKVMDRGAKYCVSYEPFPENCELWRRNLESYVNVELFEMAVVSGGREEDYDMLISVSNGDTMAHSLDTIRGRETMTIKVRTLERALYDIEPAIVKIDIEGTEYALTNDIANLFPMFNVKMFACELHLNRKDQRKQAHKFVETVDKYYEQVVPVKIGDKNWNTTGVWRLRGISN